LIEVLVSLLILMVMMLGILESLCVAIQHNMKNQLRNEGTRVADSVMANEMSKGYANVSTSGLTTYTQWKVLGVMKNYSIVRSGNTTPNSKTVTFVVSWSYKNDRFSHTASSAISQ